MKEAYIVSIDDSTITIDFDIKYKWHRDQTSDPENLKRLENALSEIMGKPMRFLIQSNTKDEAKEEIPTSQRDMRLDALQDETVKMVLEIFNGKIIDVRK